MGGRMSTQARFRVREPPSRGTPSYVPFNVYLYQYGLSPFFWYAVKNGEEVQLVPFHEYHSHKEVLPHTWVALRDCRRQKLLYFNWETGEWTREKPLPKKRFGTGPRLLQVEGTWVIRPGRSPEIAAELEQLPEEISKKRYHGDWDSRTKRRRTVLRVEHDSAIISRIFGSFYRLTIGDSPNDQDTRPVMRFRPATSLGGQYEFPGTATKAVRRRAVIVACTYANSELDTLDPVKNDLARWYNMLRKDRGWNPLDIVVLTDIAKNDPVRQHIHGQGSRVEGAKVKNVVAWMCRLVSDLDTTASRETIANSLVFVLLGHGDRFEEKPQSGHDTVNRVDNKKREVFYCADYAKRRLRGTGPSSQTIEHQGVLSDDDANRILVRRLMDLANTQLVAALDFCHSGTFLNLPYLLNPEDRTTNQIPYGWGTSREVREVESMLGVHPPMYRNGKGIIYSFSATTDDGYAKSTRAEGGILMGKFTDAFVSSALSKYSYKTFWEGYMDFLSKIERKNRDCRRDFSRIQQERPEIYKMIEERLHSKGISQKKLVLQEPMLTSSHNCRLDYSELYM